MDERTKLISTDGSFDGSNDVILEILLLSDSLVSDEGTELGSFDGSIDGVVEESELGVLFGSTNGEVLTSDDGIILFIYLW